MYIVSSVVFVLILKANVDAPYVPPFFPPLCRNLLGEQDMLRPSDTHYTYKYVDWIWGVDTRCTGLLTVPALSVCQVSSVGHINLILYSTEKCLVFVPVPFTSWEISHSSRLYFVRSPSIVLCDWNIRCSNVHKTLRDTGVCCASTKFQFNITVPLSVYFELSFFMFMVRPPLWSSGQSFWLQIQRSRVRFPALPDFLSSSGSGTGSTQPREINWGATWVSSSGSGPENRD